MTEDTSPENLRKFLESDDPAIILMGFSMAKGNRVPDELLGEILWMYMFHDDKTIRAAAKSTFNKYAPDDVKQIVRENWKASYRLKEHHFVRRMNTEIHREVNKLFRPIEPPSVNSLIRGLSVMGKIGDKRAVKSLNHILKLSHPISDNYNDAKKALKKLGHEVE